MTSWNVFRQSSNTKEEVGTSPPYICPPSTTKTCYVKVLTVTCHVRSKRLLLANRFLRTAENTSWLHLDPWESLYNAGSVGEVVTEKRLRAYVKRVCKATVPVFVVPQEALKNKALPVSPPGISNRGGRVLNRLILRVDKEPKLEFFLPLFQERFDHVQANHVSDQSLVYEELIRTTDYPLVSLDTVFPGDYQLGVSRLYDLGGFKKSGLCLGQDAVIFPPNFMSLTRH